MSARRRYRPLGVRLALPVWGWLVVLLFFVVTCTGVILDLSGQGRVGHWVTPVGYIGGFVCISVGYATNHSSDAEHR